EIEFGIKSDAMTVMYPGDGQEEPPKGVRGGLDGVRAERFVVRKSGESTKLPNAARIELAQGDVVRGIDCSGGGYGSPLERDPERVLNDVLEKYETEGRAADVYGVIFDSYPVRDSSKVDAKATVEKRRALATI
ncbi:hydantoinase B/oxoprolinase family protein, partial [Rhizobium giardinii]|uniref:hydantoinase B/oxoprolinase family protein n=1 Tax=Rhizobium giardinii TaxID=56731 RepID=UPI00058F92A1